MGSRNMTKEREYNILFIIQKEQKIVYMETSFSKDPSAVLRKHLRGENRETEAFFSRKKAEEIPGMWIWKAGWLTHKKAQVCLLEWQKAFLSEGYRVLGKKITDDQVEHLPKLTGIEKRALRSINVADLLRGKIADRVESEHGGMEKRSALQKHYVDATDQMLQMRVKWDTAYRFRLLCDNLGMTQNQALELLISEHTGEIRPLMWELRTRLEKADDELKRKIEEIERLREALRKSEEGKEYPQKYKAAILQNELLRTLIKSFPMIEMPKERMLKRYSQNQGKQIFPEGKLYAFPKEEGTLRIRVEHMQHSAGHPSCLFIYGKSESGDRLKIRWYPQKQIVAGESMWDSPYLWKNSPWILAVRQEGDAMELVGSSPDLAKIWFDPEPCDLTEDELLDKKVDVQQNHEESDREDKWEKEDMLYNEDDEWDEEDDMFYDEDDEFYEEENEKKTLPEDSLERKILDAEKKKFRDK